jgi:hypothetical protein
MDRIKRPGIASRIAPQLRADGIARCCETLPFAYGYERDCFQDVAPSREVKGLVAADERIGQLMKRGKRPLTRRVRFAAIGDLSPRGEVLAGWSSQRVDRSADYTHLSPCCSPPLTLGRCRGLAAGARGEVALGALHTGRLRGCCFAPTELPRPTLAYTPPHLFQFHCRRCPHGHMVAARGKIIAQPCDICLGASQGRWVTVNKLCDIHSPSVAWGLPQVSGSRTMNLGVNRSPCTPSGSNAT